MEKKISDEVDEQIKRKIDRITIEHNQKVANIQATRDNMIQSQVKKYEHDKANTIQTFNDQLENHFNLKNENYKALKGNTVKQMKKRQDESQEAFTKDLETNGKKLDKVMKSKFLRDLQSKPDYKYTYFTPNDNPDEYIEYTLKSHNELFNKIYEIVEYEEEEELASPNEDMTDKRTEDDDGGNPFRKLAINTRDLKESFNIFKKEQANVVRNRNLPVNIASARSIYSIYKNSLYI
jgi:hypothetical protein